jgi:hypothetical protein
LVLLLSKIIWLSNVSILSVPDEGYSKDAPLNTGFSVAFLSSDKTATDQEQA